MSSANLTTKEPKSTKSGTETQVAHPKAPDIPKSHERIIRSETKIVDGRPTTRSVKRLREYYTHPVTGNVIEDVTEEEIPNEQAQSEIADLTSEHEHRFRELEREMKRLSRSILPYDFRESGRGSPVGLLDWEFPAHPRETTHRPALEYGSRSLNAAREARIEAEKAVSAAHRHLEYTRSVYDRALENERLGSQRHS